MVVGRLFVWWLRLGFFFLRGVCVCLGCLFVLFSFCCTCVLVVSIFLGYVCFWFFVFLLGTCGGVIGAFLFW